MSNDSSGTALAALLADMGGPLRKANLRAIADALTPWETFELRKLLNSRVLCFAELTGLPPELIIAIAEFLDLRDLARCAQVSKAWRALWTQSAIVPGLCRYFFPGLAETLAYEGKAVDYGLFRETSRKYVTKAMAKYTARGVRWFRYPDENMMVDTDIHPDGILPPITGINEPVETTAGECIYGVDRACYCNGIVAWNIELATIVIDNLYTGKRRVVQAPEAILKGRICELSGLSEHLVVLRASYAMYVYHINENKWAKVTLPGLFNRHIVSRDRVFLSGDFQNDVLAWRWGGKLLEVKVPRAKASVQWYEQTGCIFHPTEENVMFVVTYECIPEAPQPRPVADDGEPAHREYAGIRILVHEYHDRKLIRSTHLDVVVRDDSFGPAEPPLIVPIASAQISDIETRFRVTCNPLSSCGGRYSLGMAYTQPISLTEGSHRCACWRRDKTEGKLLHFTFDVFTRQISLSSFENIPQHRHCPSEEQFREDRSWWPEHAAFAHAWGDQLLVHNDYAAGFEPKWPTGCTLAARRLDPQPYSIYSESFFWGSSWGSRFSFYGDDDFTLILGPWGYIWWDFRPRDGTFSASRLQLSENDWEAAGDSVKGPMIQWMVTDTVSGFGMSSWRICHCEDTQ